MYNTPLGEKGKCPSFWLTISCLLSLLQPPTSLCCIKAFGKSSKGAELAPQEQNLGTPAPVSSSPVSLVSSSTPRAQAQSPRTGPVATSSSIVATVDVLGTTVATNIELPGSNQGLSPAQVCSIDQSESSQTLESQPERQVCSIDTTKLMETFPPPSPQAAADH